MLRFLVIALIAYYSSGQCTGDGPPPAELLTGLEVARVDSLLTNRARPTHDTYGRPVETIDRREILRLLKAQQYDSLEAILAERWDSTRVDIRHEDRLRHVYETFVQGSGAIEPQLTHWVAQRPASGEARIAMASYWHGRALEARSAKARVELTPEEIAGMNRHSSAGLAAVREAFARVPDHLTAYIVQLELLKVADDVDPEMARGAFQSALQAHPTSFNLRWTILGMLEPRWGGSIELMRAFATTAEEHVPRNEMLRAIAGAVPHAESFMQRDDFGMALALLDQASFHGDHYRLAASYGELLTEHQKFVDALAAFDRALAVYPQGRLATQGRAKLLVRIGALTEDPAVRDRVWDEAEKMFTEMRDLRPPYGEPGVWLSRIRDARAYCANESPPCMSGI